MKISEGWVGAGNLATLSQVVRRGGKTATCHLCVVAGTRLNFLRIGLFHGVLFVMRVVVYSAMLACLGGCSVPQEGEASTTDGEETSGSTLSTTTSIDPTWQTEGPQTSQATQDSTEVSSDDPSQSGGESASETGESSVTDSDTGSTTDTACGRAGGEGGLIALASIFHDQLLVDDRLNAYFLTKKFDNSRFSGCMAELFAEGLACPDAVYSCNSLGPVHSGMGVSGADFDNFRSDFVDAVEIYRETVAPAFTQDDLEILLGLMDDSYGSVVEDHAGEATLYQRIGRKPAIKALVGSADDPTSWIGRTVVDATLSTFFSQTELDRLQTCLTRQLISIDGPEIYGDEVDGPEGVDPGVSLIDPCREMLAAHQVVNDSNSPVSVGDFSEMMLHLIAAMDVAQVAQTDQEIVVAAFEELCGAIVGDHPNDCPGTVQTIIVEAEELGLTVPGTYNGSLGSMACVELEVIDDGFNFVDEVEVEVGISNTWLSDLTIKLVNPEGSTVTLVSRPGLDENADDGVEVGGENSDLLWTHPLTFAQDGPHDAESMGMMLTSNQVVCRDDGACTFKPNSGAALAGDLDDLVGQQAPGVWELCVGDASGADGPLNYVGLKIRKTKFEP